MLRTDQSGALGLGQELRRGWDLPACRRGVALSSGSCSKHGQAPQLLTVPQPANLSRRSSSPVSGPEGKVGTPASRTAAGKPPGELSCRLGGPGSSLPQPRQVQRPPHFLQPDSGPPVGAKRGYVMGAQHCSPRGDTAALAPCSPTCSHPPGGFLPATWASCPLALTAHLLASTSAFIRPCGSRPDPSRPLVAAQLRRPASQIVGAWLHPSRVPSVQR